MSTLLFMLGIIAGAVLAIFAFSKVVSTMHTKDRTAQDLIVSVIWVVVCVAVAMIFYYFLNGAFIGYVVGLIVGVLVSLTPTKTSEA